MGGIRNIKNEGLKKIFAAGQGRKQRQYDEEVFGKQERGDDLMESIGHAMAREIFEKICEYGIDSVTAIEATRLAIEALDQDMCEGDFYDAVGFLDNYSD